jgi:hypothetical protein
MKIWILQRILRVSTRFSDWLESKQNTLCVLIWKEHQKNRKSVVHFIPEPIPAPLPKYGWSELDELEQKAQAEYDARKAAN